MLHHPHSLPAPEGFSSPMFTHSLSANQAGLFGPGVKKGPQPFPRFAGASTALPSSQRDSFQKTAQQTATPVDGSQPMASPLPRQAQPLKFTGIAPKHTREKLLEFFSDCDNQNLSMTEAAERLGGSKTLLTRNVKPLVEEGYLIQTLIDMPERGPIKAHHTSPAGKRLLKESEKQSALKEALKGFVNGRIKAGYYYAKNDYIKIPAPELAYLKISRTERNPEQYASEEVKDAYCAWKKIPRESIQEGGKGQKAGEHFFEFSEFLRGVLRKTLAPDQEQIISKFKNMSITNK
jgi:hypothetical protein